MTYTVLLVVVCLFLVGTSAQTTATWSGGNGDWWHAPNWDIGIIPSNASFAVIFDVTSDNVTITLGQSVTINTLTCEGATTFIFAITKANLTVNLATTEYMTLKLNSASILPWGSAPLLTVDDTSTLDLLGNSSVTIPTLIDGTLNLKGNSYFLDLEVYGIANFLSGIATITNFTIDDSANVTAYPGVVVTAQNVWFLSGYFQVNAPLTFGYLELGGDEDVELTLKANFTVASLLIDGSTSTITSPISTVGLSVTSKTVIQSDLYVINTTLWLSGTSTWSSDGDIYLQGTHGYIVSSGTFSWLSGSPDLVIDYGGTFINYGTISIVYTSSEVIIKSDYSSTSSNFINAGIISFPYADSYLEVSNGVLFHQCSSGTLSFNIVDNLSTPPYIGFVFTTPVLGNPILDGTIEVTFASAAIAAATASTGDAVLQFSAAPNGASSYYMFDGNLITNIADTLVMCYDASTGTGTGTVFLPTDTPASCGSLSSIPIIGTYHNAYCVAGPPSTPSAPSSPKAPSTASSPSTPSSPSSTAAGPSTPSSPSAAGKLVCASLLLLVSFALVL